MSLSLLRDKVVIIFYETKNTKVIEKNRDLKTMVNHFYELHPSARKQISILVIIDCAGASWPFKGIWKKKLADNSQKEELTVYGDWDGSFAGDYQVVEDETNFILIDKKGIIRYYKPGRIEQEEFEKIETLLEVLTKEF